MTKERRVHKLWNRLSFYHVYHSSTILPPAFPIPLATVALISLPLSRLQEVRAAKGRTHFAQSADAFGAKRLRHQTRGRAGYSSEARIRKGGKDARHCKAMTACPTGAVG